VDVVDRDVVTEDLAKSRGLEGGLRMR